jgi:hypothetical protein
MELHIINEDSLPLNKKTLKENVIDVNEVDFQTSAHGVYKVSSATYTKLTSNVLDLMDNPIGMFTTITKDTKKVLFSVDELQNNEILLNYHDNAGGIPSLPSLVTFGHLDQNSIDRSFKSSLQEHQIGFNTAVASFDRTNGKWIVQTRTADDITKDGKKTFRWIGELSDKLEEFISPYEWFNFHYKDIDEEGTAISIITDKSKFLSVRNDFDIKDTSFSVETCFNYIIEKIASTYALLMKRHGIVVEAKLNDKKASPVEPLFPIFKEHFSEPIQEVDITTIDNLDMDSIIKELDKRGYKDSDLEKLKRPNTFFLTMEEGLLSEESSDSNRYFYKIESNSPRSILGQNGRMVQDVDRDVYGIKRHPSSNQMFLFSNIDIKDPELFIPTQADKTAFQQDHFVYQFIVLVLKALVSKQKRQTKTSKKQRHKVLLNICIEKLAAIGEIPTPENDYVVVRTDIETSTPGKFKDKIVEIKVGDFSYNHIGQTILYYLKLHHEGRDIDHIVLVVENIRKELVNELISFLEFLPTAVPGFSLYVVKFSKLDSFLRGVTKGRLVN